MSTRSAPRISAGLVMYRKSTAGLEIFLAHPGGPFFARKDAGHWTIPKGEPNAGEDDLLAVARREFEEEVGIKVEGVEFIPLGNIQQKGGKIVHAWGFAGDLPANHEHRCNTFKLEWPPGSGAHKEFPEIDRACFFTFEQASLKIKASQLPLLERLREALE